MKNYKVSLLSICSFFVHRFWTVLFPATNLTPFLQINLSGITIVVPKLIWSLDADISAYLSHQNVWQGEIPAKLLFNLFNWTWGLSSSIDLDSVEANILISSLNKAKWFTYLMLLSLINCQIIVKFLGLISIDFPWSFAFEFSTSQTKHFVD